MTVSKFKPTRVGYKHSLLLNNQYRFVKETCGRREFVEEKIQLFEKFRKINS